MLELNRESYTVQGIDVGSSNITLPLYPTATVSQSVTVVDSSVEIHKLDPIVATLRLSLSSVPDSRLGQGSVTLEVLQGVLFVQEEAVVTASVVFKDGHRSLITDRNELIVTSSNSSIVSVTGNVILGEKEGEAVVNITWVNPACNVEVLTAEVIVSVELDVSRPTFVPAAQTTEVPEDSPIGHTVTIVTAVVQDEVGGTGDQATDVQYHFLNGVNFDGLFSLDPTSGDVILNGRLDRETTTDYTLFVEATNSAQRRAEQGDSSDGDNDDNVSGSGSGSGEMLMPGSVPTPTNISLNIAVLTVSYSTV